MNKSYKTLIIDDEPSLLVGLSAIMKRNGYDVIVASDGKEGLELAQKEMPDIIVSDVMMPPPNGFELQNHLKQNPQTKDIPFIFLTARTEREDRLAGIKKGADDYITKPFDREELILRVEAILRRKEIEREHGRREMLAKADQQMDSFKQEVLRNFQHELFTPITNIMIPLKAMVTQKFENPEDLSNFTQSALSNANRLHSLVEDVSLLTNIDQGNLNTFRQPIELEIEIQKSIDKCLEKYTGKRINTNIEIEGEGQIFAPRREFRRALTHLIDNAIKFSPENGVISVRAIIPGNGGCQIIITDNGSGIPQEFREKVFDRLNQVSSGDSRAYQGLGVGLTISRAIARSLGGDVKFLESDQGCRVLFSIAPEDNTIT